jgi:hypothetical protein
MLFEGSARTGKGGISGTRYISGTALRARRSPYEAVTSAVENL